MADDTNHTNKKEHAGRAGHSPQHASAKHVRPLDVNGDGVKDKAAAEHFTVTDNSGGPEPDSVAAPTLATPLTPEDEAAIGAAEPEPDSEPNDADSSAAGSDPEQPANVPPAVKVGGTGGKPGSGWWQWITSHKKVSIPLAVALLLVLLAAIPYTRYLLAGTVVRKNFSVLVMDSQTHKPVTSAAVTLEGKTTTTNNKGVATIKANVGHATLQVSKKYYTSASKSVLVPIGSQKSAEQISLTATGRQVPVVITNKITGKPAADITVAAQGTEAKSDAKGELTLVLPAGKDTVQATLKGNGFNTATVTVKVTQNADPANTFAVTPSGKVYFLSNQSGNVDVVKTDLDGANRQTVLAGTGKEDRGSTMLVASKDWKYLALLSKRDGANKLYLINAADDSHLTIDEGAGGSFGTVGWSGHYFVYTLTRSDLQNWQPNRQMIKSYDADNNKQITIDQTAAAGNGDPFYFNESLGGVYLLGDKVVYSKNMFGVSLNDTNGHQATLNVADPDGSDKNAVKGWGFAAPFTYYYGTINVSVNMVLGGASNIYFAVSTSPQDKDPDTAVYQYANGKVATVPGKSFNDLQSLANYNRYITAPAGGKTLWSEARDSKQVPLLGDANGTNGKQVMLTGTNNDDQYYAVGWYTDKYLLVGNGGAWYIVSANGGTPVKISGVTAQIYYGTTYGYYGY